MLLRISGAATLSLLISASAAAAPTRCEEVLKKIGKDLADVHCFESTDLTTNKRADHARQQFDRRACRRSRSRR